MRDYFTATICVNGHIVDFYHADAQKFCSVCGKHTLSYCTHCRAPIRGRENDGITRINQKERLDYYCYNCNGPYPWTEKLISSATELIALDGGIDADTRELLITAIPDLIVETPYTPVAVARYSRFLAKAPTLIRDTMYQLLIGVLSESSKSILFPQPPQ